VTDTQQRTTGSGPFAVPDGLVARGRTPVNVLAVVAAVLETLQVIRRTADGRPVGVDLEPVLGAARVVTRGHGAIYGDHQFVYLPSSALALVPVAHGGRGLFTVMAALELTCVAASVFLLARCLLTTPWWPTIAGVTVVLVMRSTLATDSAYLENLGMVVTLLLVCSIIAMSDERWALACAALGVSLLIKPILLPLFLVPLLARRWRETFVTLAGVAVVAGLSAAVAPGGWGMFALAGRLVGTPKGSSLPPSDNLALASLGRQHHVAAVVVVLVRLLVVGGVAAACVVAGRRRQWRRDALPLSYVIVLGTFMAGGFYELSYAFLLAPLPVVVAQIWPYRKSVACGLAVGMALVFLPEPTLGGSRTVLAALWCLGSAIAFGSLVIGFVTPERVPDGTAPSESPVPAR